MTIQLSPSPQKLPATVAVPGNGELVDNDSVVEYVQTIINALGYDKIVTVKLTEGGALSPAGGLSVVVPAGKIVSLNGLQVASTDDGGLVIVTDIGGLQVNHGSVFMGAVGLTSGGTAFARLRAPGGVIKGSNATGTHLFSTGSYDHVWNNLAAAGGCVWQIDAPPAGGFIVGERIKFVNFDANPIAIKDHLGAAIVSILFFTNNIFKIELCWNGSSWDTIDESVLH